MCTNCTPSLWRWNWYRVPKRRPTTIWRRGNTQKKIYNIQITAKVWNQECNFCRREAEIHNFVGGCERERIRYSVLCTEDRGNVILRKLVIPYQTTRCLSPTVQIQKPSLPTPSILRFKILFQFCWYNYLRDKNYCLCSEDGGFDFRSGSSKSLGRCRGNFNFFYFHISMELLL